MPSHRPERVAEMVHRELAERLLTEVKDPELEPISIIHVEMTRDLGRATVRYLPLGGGEASKSLIGALDRVSRRLRGPIGRALRLRTAPELVFVYDADHEEAVRVTHLIEQVARELPSEDEA